HVANLNRNVLDGSAAALRRLVRSIRARLKRREHRGFTIRNHIRIELAEKDASGESNFAPFGFRANAVADQRLAKTRRQLWCEITNLVSVSQKHKARIDLLDDLLHAAG